MLEESRSTCEAEILESSFQELEEWLTSKVEGAGIGEMSVADSALSIRVIGEFSSGKTRLVSEMIKERLPAELQPVSSLGRETFIPLEITYGPDVELCLVHWEDGGELSGELVETFQTFPTRQELEKEISESEEKYRLRLSLPEPSLRTASDLVSGEQEASRIFLLDTPGWNSGELDEDRGRDLVGYATTAVVYVCKAGRLSAAYHEEEFGILIDELESPEKMHPFDDIHLLLYITNWDDTPENEQALETFKERVEETVDKKDCFFRYQIKDPQAIDFETAEQTALDEFRRTFWEHLRQSLNQKETDDCGGSQEPEISPWDAFVELCNGDGPGLVESAKAIESIVLALRELLDNFFDGKSLVPAWNWTRLEAYSPDRRARKLFESWERRVALDNGALNLEDVESLKLSRNHPLSRWWNEVILWELSQVLVATEELLQKMRYQFENLDDLAGRDLERELFIALVDSHFKASREFASLDGIFCDELRRLLNDEAEPAKAIAAMLAISAAQAPLKELYFPTGRGWFHG